jgi:hypothetical protein
MKKGIFLIGVLLFGISDGMLSQQQSVGRQYEVFSDEAATRIRVEEARAEKIRAERAADTAERRAIRIAGVARAADVRAEVATKDEEKKNAAAAKAFVRKNASVSRLMSLLHLRGTRAQIAEECKRYDALRDAAEITAAAAKKATAERIKAERAADAAGDEAERADNASEKAETDAAYAVEDYLAEVGLSTFELDLPLLPELGSPSFWDLPLSPEDFLFLRGLCSPSFSDMIDM